VHIPFFTYHIMISLGMFFIAVTLFGLYKYKRGTLFETRWLLWTFVFAVLGAMIANQAGWVAAEVGRQPWVVYGLLRTSDALSKAVTAEAVLTSIIMFMIIYALLFVVWIYILNEKIQHGPDEYLEPLERTNEPLLATVASLVDRAGPSMTDTDGDTSRSKE
jgi:cytochrome d ubiquinol oxidase subunit I